MSERIGGDDHRGQAGRMLLGMGEPAQHGQPAADGVGARRQPLVRQRLPGREHHHPVGADQVADRRQRRPRPRGRWRPPAAPAGPGAAMVRGDERPDPGRPGDPVGDGVRRPREMDAKYGSACTASSSPARGAWSGHGAVVVTMIVSNRQQRRCPNVGDRTPTNPPPSRQGVSASAYAAGGTPGESQASEVRGQWPISCAVAWIRASRCADGQRTLVAQPIFSKNQMTRADMSI